MAAKADLSPEMEDYLEAIADLIGSAGAARVTDIAARLSVRKPSVSLALKSLAEKGLVNHVPYRTPTLTKAGKVAAARVRQRHDTLKRFLTDVLFVEDELADANACRLEHAVDREVLTHLTNFMDFVERCPRGGAAWIKGFEYRCDPDSEGPKCQRCIEAALAESRDEDAETQQEVP